MKGGRAVGRNGGRKRAFVTLLLTVLPAYRLTAQCPDGAPPPCRGARPAAGAAPNSIAVLYFDNLSRDTADAYLAQGLTEAIITQLGAVERVTVKSRYAVRRFRADNQLDPAVVGRSLGVTWIVTGSVQRGAGRLRVTAELARAASGDRAWGQAYERGDGDVLAIQEDIARGIVTGVAGRLLPAERAALAVRPTRSGEAYDHLLRGDVLLAQRTPGSVRRAIGEYETATRVDPVLVTAWAKIGVAYGIFTQRGWTTDGRPPAESLIVRGAAAADRAVALDSTNSDAWMAVGFARMMRDPRAWTGTADAFRRSVTLNPRNAEAWTQLGDVLDAMDRTSERDEAFRRADAVEPGRPYTVLSFASRSEPRTAIALFDSVLALDPGFVDAHYFRGVARWQLGDSAGARADRDARERLAPAGAELIGVIHAARLSLVMGDTADARARALRVLAALPSSGPVHFRMAGYLGQVLYVMGERDAAFDLLQRAGPSVMLWTYRTGQWAGDERFRQLFELSRPPWAR